MLAAIGCGTGQDGIRDEEVPVTAMEVVVTIGGLDQDRPEYEFGYVSGLTALPNGGVAVADAVNHEIRVFDREGMHLFSFGRSGAGPGEFNRPCCVTVDGSGRLWVRDGGNARYSAFTIGTDGAEYLGQVRMAHGDVNRAAPLTFDEFGYLIDIGLRQYEAAGDARVTRLHVDSTGNVRSSVAVHRVPDDSLSTKAVQRGTSTLFGHQPYGPTELAAHSPTSEFAHAVSSRYAIDWRAADGSLLRTVTGDVTRGPALSDRERQLAETRLDDQAGWMGVSRNQMGFEVPQDKPVLRSLHFDRSGRLWVERQVPDGANRLADVYDVNGDLVEIVTWPPRVSFDRGHLDSDGAWGIETDSLDVAKVVRLEPVR